MVLLNMHGLNLGRMEKLNQILIGFGIANESKRKPNKLWVDQGREFYNKLMQEWLDGNDVVMYPTHNEGKLVVDERFVRTLKVKICKKVTANDRIFVI